MAERPTPSARHAARREPRAGGGLGRILHEIDGRSFDAYRRLVGRHELGEFSLIVERVPLDPFAGPARARLVVGRAKSGLPAALVATKAGRIGVEDFLARGAMRALERAAVRAGTAPPGTGRVFVEPCGAAMLERSTCRITEQEIELRLFLDLPAAFRRVRGSEAETLFSTLLGLATSTLLFSARRVEEAHASANVVEDHAALQAELTRRGLVAFVGDGSRVAREGASEAPRSDGREVAFVAPESLAVEIDLPHAGKIRGAGFPAGVTVLAGGTFHGKSSLLDALSRGVHPHPPGDGRERIATLPDAVAVRAEVGRPVRRVDLSAFLDHVPSGERAADFSAESAGPVVAQAASLVEALEAGARVLLVDEDQSAANLLVRDGRMQRLVPRPGEPVVPLVDRLREMYEKLGVSTILAIGGCGDYLEVADTVLVLEDYRIVDATDRARKIAAATSSTRLKETLPPMNSPASREPYVEAGPAAHGVRLHDLTGLAQIVEPGQLRALERMHSWAADRMAPGKDLASLVAEIDKRLDEEGLDALDPPGAYDLARPRSHEIAAAVNRWRAVRFRRPDR